jgi:ABC-2 type transport system permease protein
MILGHRTERIPLASPGPRRADSVVHFADRVLQHLRRTSSAAWAAGGTPRVSVLVVDEDRSAVSGRLVQALLQEPSLDASTHPKAKKGEPDPPDYTAASAETAVKQGNAPAALIIPKGFGAHPIALGPGGERAPIRLLHDSSDPVAAQMVGGMLQKVVMTSLPDTMAQNGHAVFRERPAAG